jgi:quercetin dioxygenase-like cupin family protein
MLSSLRLPFTFDVPRLEADLARAGADGWEKHFNPAYYDGDWSGVPLRSNSSHVLRLYIDPARPHAFANTPELDRCPYFLEVIEQFRCPVQAARLLRLAAGSKIVEHRDHQVSLAHGEARIHIPIVTNPDVEFILGGEPLRLAPGECWYLNVDLPHSLANRGTTDRVHLVIDAIVDDWLRGVIDASRALP